MYNYVVSSLLISTLHPNNMEGVFLPFFLLFLLHVPLIHAQGDVCAKVDCGKGICVPNNSLLGFDCVCYSGWKKLQLGPLVFPSCVLPNCTINFQCGNSAPPPPPPPPPPPLNLTSPCNFIWCGDGKCVVNGTGHYCQCHEGSNNLYNLTDTACFKKCSFGSDCSGLGLGPLLLPPPPLPPPPPPPPPLPLPPPQSPSNGSKTVSKNSGSCDGLNLLLLYAVILALVL